MKSNRTDLPVDGLRQGQRVGPGRSGGGEFGVVNVVRLSVQLQRTKHTCSKTRQKKNELSALKLRHHQSLSYLLDGIIIYNSC